MLSLVSAPLSDSIVSPPELKAPTSVGSLDHNSEKMGLDHSRQMGSLSREMLRFAYGARRAQRTYINGSYNKYKNS